MSLKSQREFPSCYKPFLVLVGNLLLSRHDAATRKTDSIAIKTKVATEEGTTVGHRIYSGVGKGMASSVVQFAQTRPVGRRHLSNKFLSDNVGSSNGNCQPGGGGSIPDPKTLHPEGAPHPQKPQTRRRPHIPKTRVTTIESINRLNRLLSIRLIKG